MKLIEKTGSLFTAPKEYYLAHCISGDFALGAGIAKKFDKVYQMRTKLFESYPSQNDGYLGEALLVDNVFNLVTKSKYYHKPTYDTLYEAVYDMREQCERLNINKIAVPKLGCGLDKLNWEEVKDIIYDVFADTDIEVCAYIK